MYDYYFEKTIKVIDNQHTRKFFNWNIYFPLLNSLEIRIKEFPLSLHEQLPHTHTHIHTNVYMSIYKIRLLTFTGICCEDHASIVHVLGHNKIKQILILVLVLMQLIMQTSVQKSVGTNKRKQYI